MTIFLRVNYQQDNTTEAVRQERIASMEAKGALKEKFDPNSGYWLAVDTPEQGRDTALDDDLCTYFFMHEVPSDNPYDDSKISIESAYIVDELIPYNELREGEHDYIKLKMLEGCRSTYVLVNSASTHDPKYIEKDFTNDGMQIYDRSGENITPTIADHEAQANLATADKEDGVFGRLLEEQSIRDYKELGLDG